MLITERSEQRHETLVIRRTWNRDVWGMNLKEMVNDCESDCKTAIFPFYHVKEKNHFWTVAHCDILERTITAPFTML